MRIRVLRLALVGAAAGAALVGTLVYRTLQLGRVDAQPVVLEAVNPAGEFLGPEGIAFDAAGRLYVGDGQGLVWTMEPGAKPQIYADLGRVEGPSSRAIQAGGMAFDGQGNLYVCAYGYAGGSVLRVEPARRRVEIFARDFGVCNYLVATADRSYLWVSDYRNKGRLLHFALGGPVPAQPDLALDGFEYPNGLALGKDERTLYVAETYSGAVTRVTFSSLSPRIERLIDLKGTFATGSLDGLAFDPRDRSRRFLYVAENIRGMFTVVDVEAQPPQVVKRLAMALMGGRPCPASMTIRDGYLYFTDLWACSPFRILFGFPKLHNHAYRFRVTDLSALY